MMDATNSTQTARRSRLARLLALGGIVGPIVFIAAFTIAGAIRPGYSPIHRAISALGTGATGWQEDVPALILGVMLLCFTASFVLLMRTVMAKTSLVLSTILLTVFALVWITVAIFTSAPATVGIHTIASIVGEIAVLVAFVLVGSALRKAPGWRGWSAYSLIAGAVTLIILVVTYIAARPSIPASLRLGGLTERIMVIEILIWFVAFGWKLFRTPAHVFLNGEQDARTTQPAG